MSNPSDQTQNSVLGPFTKETFHQPRWKQMKDKIFSINSTNEDECLPEVRLFLQFLLDLNAQPDYNKYFGETSIKNFFFDDFLPANAKNLIACKYFNNNELLEISNACLKQMVLFWFKTLHEDHPKLGEMAKVILDPSRTYYKFNNQESLVSSVISGFLVEPSVEHLQWIQTLKEGDLVDCVKIDQTYKKMCWSQAKVAYVMDPHIKVIFLNDHEKTSRYLEKKANANEIAPQKTKAQDFDWRLTLKAGDELDACDTTHVWYNATVLDTKDTPLDDGASVRELFIGYRVYTPEGDRTDPEGRKFNGWSAKYDEWVSATDPRISKKNTMAKKLYMGSSSNSEDPVVDDSNDKIYNQDGKNLYALIRANHSKSTFLINLVNNFGEMGGFERIYERITNTKNWAPIETVSVLSSVLGNLSSILHRDFALDYIPRFKEAVWRNLLYGPESNIRNFTKDKIEGIIQAFDSLLKRVYSLPEKQEIVESFNLQICCVCFDSQFLERKLQGLKTLLQVIKDIRYHNSNQAKFINNTYLNGFLSRNNIFTKIYGSKGHVQLIQRSAEFLKYMLHEDILNQQDFQTIWTATTKGDMEAKLAVYKVLSDISLHLKSGHLDHIITKIAEIPPQEVIAEEIELVYELSKFSIKPAWFIKKARDFYWQIISDTTGLYAPNIVELTLTKFCDIMRGLDFKDERINVLYDCLENIKQEVSVLPSLKIMKKLIDHYPTSPASAEKFTKSTCIDHLCKDKGLLGLIIQDLKALKSKLKAKIEGNKGAVTEQTLDALVGERSSYINHITERMQFVHYLLTNNSSGEVTLNYELLSDLWDVIVNNALIPGERDVVYKWIKEVAESKSGFPMSIEDLQKFFREKMNSKDTQDRQAMTKEGFKCFKNVFLVINEKLLKISKVVAPTNTSYSSLYGGYGSGGYYYSTAKQNEDAAKKEDDFDYTVNVLPNELEGVDSIWDFILIAEEDGVAEKAIDFLNKLYLHVNSELESKIVEIRKEYLDTCNKHLKETLESQKSISEAAFTNRCVRCLRLISSIMDESEKYGIGNLKSHSGLVKGELLTFTVINDISTGSDVPKKTEIRMYSNATVFDLRVEIAKQFKATWDQVKLMRRTDPKEIKDNENGRTVREIRLKNSETITAAKRPTPPIPQATIVLPDDTLNPIAKKIFLEWFGVHSQDGKMNPDQCAAFIHSCTNDNCKAEDKRVKDVFATYDDDKDGFLTEENFLKFYQMACKQRPQVVWNNLHSHHYRNDLKKVTEVEQEKVEVTSLARYIISSNDEYFQLVFSLLGFGGKIAIEAWNLLNRLPTSPQVFADMIMLKGIRENASSPNIDWNLILDLNSKYKLLYALHVIEYLMEDDETDEEEEDEQDEGKKQMGRLLSRDPKLLEYKKTWQADFIAFGGFDHLFKIFNIFAKQDSSKLKMFDKNILSFVLKILKNYLSAAFAATVPNIYRNLSFIRLFYLSLDFIQDYLNSEHTRPSRENSFKLSQETGEPLLADTRPRAGSKNQIEAGKLPRKDSKAEEKKKEKLKIEESEEFATLVDRLRGDLGSKILSTINLKDLLEVTSSLGYNILSDSGDLESEDRMIVEYSLSILMAIIFFNEDYIKYFLNPENSPDAHQGADKYMLEGVFCPKVINVRKYFSHAIYVLCRHTARFQNAFASKYFINLFLNNLPSSSDGSKKDCNQYFELLCKLIEETYINAKRPRSLSNIEEDGLDFKNLLDKVIQQLRSHISTENRSNLNLTDKILVGLLNLCEKILTVQPELRDSLGSQGHNNLVGEIFSVCLFDVQDRDDNSTDAVALVDPNNYVKCKSKESRSIAYKLLATLCKDHESNMLTLLQCMKNLTITILKLNTNKGWGYSPSSDTKSLFGYVGIKNLGCICYMNAMLQQFFMTPTFRYALLAADDKKEPNWVKKEKFTCDDNVVHQLQQMFGFLELSDRQDYNPQEFCFAFKDHAGQPVNVSVQQDTQEFLNMIFDKLENGLKQTPFQHILEGVYGGKTSNQVICGGCGTMREREDIFYNLSVEVKNLKTVYDSFEKFITGETIEDYFCDTCKKKNSITKRTCLSDLPNVLIIHLQRIVFDLDTLMNQKINTRLEFPSQLNVEPYTKEGLEWREKSKKKSSPVKKAEGGADMGSGEKLKSNKQASEGTEKKDDEPDEIEIDDEDYEIIDNEKDGSAKKSRKPKKEEDEVLGPYMKHPKDYYEYRLAGVVVHVGTADFGHYYSYINTNRGKTSAGEPQNDRWLEYNDSLIKDFDAKDIENECFGGAGSDSSDDYWSWGKVGREYSKNAYILVYERVLKTPLKLTVRTPEDKQDLNTIFTEEKPDASAQKVEKTTVGEGENKQEVDNYYYDFYQLEKYVSPRIYKNVWKDNHKFMFERHIYTDEFFRFVKEVCGTLKIPDEVQHQQIVNFVNPKHSSLSTDVKQSIGNLINILGVLVFYLLARAHDNNTITELAEKLKQFLSLNPEAAWTLFDHFVCQDLKNVLELFLNCPDKQVRSATSQIILHTINVLVSHYKLTLNPARQTLTEEQLKELSEEQRHVYTVEDSILRFLDALISYIPTEVAKAWMKFAGFFEFWRDFSISGDSQMSYLYQKNFITVLIDFYLGSNSPVPEFSEKKHTMGNRYTEPEFNPLIQTVAHMVKRAKVASKTGSAPFTSMARQGLFVFELSQTDAKCLFCPEFYEKTLRDKFDFQSFGHIIQHLTYENESFSQTIGEILLKGLNRCSYDDVKPYLEAISYFISLGDMYQLKRIEWILGYPQPFVSTMRSGPDSFGIYGNSSLEDLIVSYETPLAVENSTSLLNLILQNRKKFENLCISCVRQLLLLLDVNQTIFQYVVSLPPPSYNYAKFTDWIPVFIDYFLVDAKKYHYSTYPKEEVGLEAQKYWKSVEEKINTSVESTRKAWDQVYAQVEGLKSSDNSTNATESAEPKAEDAVESANKAKTPLSWIFKPYMIGQTFKEEEIGKKVFESADVPHEVSLVTLEGQCYIAESKPLGVGNLAFPEYLLSDNRLRAIEVDNDSPFALFVQPKGANEGAKNPLHNDIEAALRKNKAKDGSAEGEPLLEDDNDSETQDKTNVSERRNEQISENKAKEGSSGVAAEALDQEEGEITGKEITAPTEAVEGAEKSKESEIDDASNKKEEVIRERKKEREDAIEFERVIPCQEDFNFVYELNPVVRRFVFHNASPYNLICQIRIIPKTTDFLNFRVPVSTFKSKIRAQSNSCVLAIMKILPEVAWGDYDIECDVRKAEAVGGAKDESGNGGRRKNVQFHIRTIDSGTGGYSRDADDKARPAE